MKRILLRLKHGLGDVVQLTVVVKHILHYHPDTEIIVEVQKGKSNIFGGLCEAYEIGKAPGKFDEVYNLEWRENLMAEGHCPSTKITRCLQDVFNLPEIAELYGYHINIPKECKRTAASFYSSLPETKGYVLIHYQGMSSVERKNLSNETIHWLCDHLIDNDYLPIILDWDSTSQIPNQKTIFRADRSIQKDAGTIAALIDQAVLFVGIDSGPLHIAGGLDTPSIGVWTHHHPIRYFDLADNVLHMLPGDARRNAKLRQRQRGLDYFHRSYRHEYYDDINYSVVSTVCKALKIKLPTDNPMDMSFLLTSKAYNEQYYQEH